MTDAEFETNVIGILLMSRHNLLEHHRRLFPELPEMDRTAKDEIQLQSSLILRTAVNAGILERKVN